MDSSLESKWRSRGFRRLVNAARYQAQGIRHGLAHDPAIREVSIACFALIIVAILLPVGRLERLMLVLPLLLVVLMEYVNSAIEAVVDRISLEPHPLSRVAKDYGSVAVALAVSMAVLTWLVVLGPHAVTWVTR